MQRLLDPILILRLLMLSFPSRVAILEPSADRIVQFISRDAARRLVQRGQATVMDGGRMLRLTEYYALPAHPGRTHVSRGGVLAAIGMSQKYTVNQPLNGSGDRSKVTGFKSIYPEDRAFFHLATVPNGDL